MERDEFDRLTRSILNDAYAGTQLGASQLNLPNIFMFPPNATIYYTGGGGGGGGGAVEPAISMNHPVTDKAINAVTYCIDMMLEKTLCSDYPPEQLSRDMEIVTELRELVHTLNDWKD